MNSCERNEIEKIFKKKYFFFKFTELNKRTERHSMTLFIVSYRCLARGESVMKITNVLYMFIYLYNNYSKIKQNIILYVCVFEFVC